MNSLDRTLATLVDRYTSLEKETQKLMYPLSSHFCMKCSSPCCKEEICRETMESPFLSILINKQKAGYDTQNGWISPSGCRLVYGRPLVCYEFFCEDILKSPLFKAMDIKKIIRGFVSVGNRAHGNSHLLCIDDPGMISSTKIGKMIGKIALVMNEIAEYEKRKD